MNHLAAGCSTSLPSELETGYHIYLSVHLLIGGAVCLKREGMKICEQPEMMHSCTVHLTAAQNCLFH